MRKTRTNSVALLRCGMDTQRSAMLLDGAAMAAMLELLPAGMFTNMLALL